MLIIKKTIRDEKGSYVESIFESSNILKSLYFPDQERLYISFGGGQTYSYGNIKQKMYENFEKAKSQGKYFIKEIKANPQEFPYKKEFSLFPGEIEEIKKIIEEKKKTVKDE